AQVRALDGGTDADARSRDWLARPGHHLLGWHDPDYPPLLRAAPSPPLALFVAGDPMLLWHPAVAVVGSRSPSAGGRDNARAFAHALAASGLGVTSGLALGIDTAAHLAALAAGGPTVAVLGSGIDRPYPRTNAALHARIAEAGAVVSEHPPGTGALREHFPSRNRIIAGLSLGTLVVEAAQRSGALITARQAAEAGREVFAVPGSIHNPVARGCHRLIRDGAALVERADEVIAALAPLAAELGQALRRRLDAPSSVSGAPARSPRAAPDADDPDYYRLWQALGHDPTGMDPLVERTGLTIARLSSMLLVMELEGWIVAEHGRYSRKS
ncbi:DNA-protecting protein DprA, partial [Luteimonas sp. SJ-92]